MKTTTWLPWTAAILAHAVIATIVFTWPPAPRPQPETDFIAETGLFTSALTVDLTLFSEPQCEIHHIAMKPTEVPIFYGTPLKLDNPEAYFEPNQPRADTRSKLFPHSERSCWGGCTLGDERTARIYICPECESAEKQWRLAKVQSQ